MLVGSEKFGLLCPDVCQRECSLLVSNGVVGVTLTRSYILWDSPIYTLLYK